MAIKKIENALKKEVKDAPPSAASAAVETPAKQEDKTDTKPDSGIEQAERILTKMHVTPQPYVSRALYKMAVTIPTGNYENLTPSVEIEYVVPEGAIPPDHLDVLDDLRLNIAAGVLPLVQQQTNGVSNEVISSILHKAGDEERAKREIAATFMTAAPTFKWLSTFDRASARRLVTNRIASLKDGV